MSDREDLCRQHAERLAGVECGLQEQKVTLGRIEQKLDDTLARTGVLEGKMGLATWLGGLATAIGLTALGAWLSKLFG